MSGGSGVGGFGGCGGLWVFAVVTSIYVIVSIVS